MLKHIALFAALVFLFLSVGFGVMAIETGDTTKAINAFYMLLCFVFSSVVIGMIEDN